MRFRYGSGWLAGFALAAVTGMQGAAAATHSATYTFTLDLQLTVTVKGRVLDGATRAPLSGVSISLAGLNAVTGGDGSFSLANAALAAGNQLTADKTGYVQHTAPVAPPPGTKMLTLPDILLQSGTGPVVTKVAAKYAGIFLAGVPVRNLYTATINWNGATPGSVRFFANGSLLQQVGGAGPNYVCEVPMSSSFRPAFRSDANYLDVVAVPAVGVSSAPFRQCVMMVPQPTALALLSLVADPSDDDVSINVDFSIPEPGIKYVLDLPVIGKFGAEFAANASFDYTIAAGDWEAAFGVGAEGKQGKRGRRPTIPGVTRSPKMNLYVGNKEISGKILAGARGTATVAEGIRFDEVFGYGEIEAKLELGRVGLPDLLGPGLSTAAGKIPGLSGIVKTVTIIIYVIPGLEGEVVFALDPRFEFSRTEITGKVGLEAAYEPDLGVASMRLYVGGEPSATFQIPPPLLKQLRFRAYAGAEFQAWILSFSPEYVFVDVSYPTGGGNAVSALQSPLVRMIPVAGSGTWRTMKRRHLLAGPEGFAAYPLGEDALSAPASSGRIARSLEAFRAIGRTPVRGAVGLGNSRHGRFPDADDTRLRFATTWQAEVVPPSVNSKDSLRFGGSGSVPTAQADLALVTNVFPNSEPAMAGWGNELMLLYVGDNGSSNALQCTDIRWTRWDGTNWSIPAPLDLNTQGEFDPQVAFDGHGDAVALWDRVGDPDFTNADVVAMSAQMEIAWARWDRASGSWTEPQALTTNTVLDHAPLLCGPMGDGSVLAAWTRNAENLLMGTNGAGSRVLWSRWNPATAQWSAEQALLSDLPNRLSQSMAGAGSRAVYAWARDLDGVLTNAADQQLFRCEWNGTAWTAPSQVTTDEVGNRNVRVAVSAGGEAFAVWQQGPDLVMNREFAPTVSTVRTNSQTAGFADYAMTFGPAGNIVLLWQEMTAAGSDAHYMVFDPVSDTWSRDALLCADPPLERSFAPVWDDVGNLTVAFNKVRIEKVTKTVASEGGGTVDIANVPQPGQVDLYVTKRALIRDLAIAPGDLTAQGANFLPGDPVTLSATVRNAGDVAMTNVVVEFFDGDPLAGGVAITNVALAGWFDGAATNVVSAPWVVPDSATNHVLFVAVNRAGAGAEFDPLNNAQTLAVGGADLAVSLVEYAAGTNGTVRVLAQVRNGGAPAAAASQLAIRRCDGSGTNVFAPALASVETPALEPGRLAQVALDLPAGTQPEGNAFYQLRADDTDVTGDIDRDNNTAAFAVNLWLDMDGDGLPDSYENARAFLSYTNAADAAKDRDEDGVSNLAEYLAGTDPDDRFSCLSVSSLSAGSTADGLRVAWGSVSNRLYSLERSTNLMQGAFTPVEEHLLATPPENVYEDRSATNEWPYFYRIRVE